MPWQHRIFVGLVAVSLACPLYSSAKDFKITIPKRSHLTAVQRLNQEGVEEIRKHRFEKAENVFYKAYLLDPDDPFTLNNLGYIAELQGQVDRAQQFYALAGEEASDAVIYRASSRKVEGRTMREALATAMPLEINHQNVEAVRLLSQGRATEADLMLQTVLKQSPQSVFTLNNMGVAKEMEGESAEALKYYDTAAAIQSDLAAVVTLDRSWRGKPITEIASQNARNLRTRLQAEKTPEERVAELNVRGVSDVNRNDLKAAEDAFRSAYAVDPNNVFAINNIGYLSEIEGDRETAQFFYDKAQAMGGVTVGLATRRSAEGMRLSQVAADSDHKVEAKVSQEREALRQQHEPIVLRRRDNSIVSEPSTHPVAPAPQR